MSGLHITTCGGDKVAHLKRAYVLLAIFSTIRKGCTDGMVDSTDMPAQTVFEERTIPTNRTDVVGWVHQLLVRMVCMICILAVVYVVRISHFLNHPLLTVSSQCHTRLNSYICSHSWDSTCYIPSSDPNVSGGVQGPADPGPFDASHRLPTHGLPPSIPAAW